MYSFPTLTSVRRLMKAGCCLALVLGAASSSAATFENKTKQWCGQERFGGSSTVAFGDYNGDGFVDLATDDDGWTNVGGKRLEARGPRGTIAWADINNDGHLDYAVVHGPGPHFLGDGKGGFERVTPPVPLSGDCLAVAWGDINNDGLLDIYYGGSFGSRDSLWRQEPQHEQKWARVGQVPHAYCRSVVGCDFDEDHDIDFYASNYWVTRNYLWVNNGQGGGSIDSDHSLVIGGSGRSIGSCWGDLDNDGYFDLFATNFVQPGHSQSHFLRNLGPRGGYTFEDLGTRGVTYQEFYASPTAGDYDNDGDLDLFVSSVSGGNPPRLYRNDGNWVFTDVGSAEGIPWQGSSYQAAWGDVDNDGDLDLVTQGMLLINNGNDHHWLKIRLQGDGKTVNSSAIGAKVRIKLGDKTLTRQVEGGGVGQGNQNDLTLHFGLGDHADEVQFEIIWTNGKKQTGKTGVDRAIRVDME